MAEEKNSNLLFAAEVVLIVVLVFCVAGYFLTRQYLAGNPIPDQTQEDDSQQLLNWNTVQNGGLSFKYPNNFFDAGHEPQIIDIRTNPNGREFPANVQEITVNNVVYYHYHEENAAAGHQYFSDYYQPKQNTSIFILLETAETRCENYLPLQSGNTEQAKNYNDCVNKNTSRPAILQQIVNTFTLGQ